MAFLFAVSALGALPGLYSSYALAKARSAEIAEARERGETNIVTYCITGHNRWDSCWELLELTTAHDYFPNVYFSKYHGVESVVIDRYEK